MKRILLAIAALALAFLGFASYQPQMLLGATQTIGKTADGTNVQTFSGDRIYVSTFTAPASGTITSCWGRVRVTGVSTSLMKVVMYAESGSNPAAFLAQSDEVAVNWTTSTLTQFPVSGANQLAVTSGTAYWIGYWADDPGTTSYEFKRDNNNLVNRFSATPYSSAGTPTDPFFTGGSSNGPLNVYCEFDDGAGGGGVIGAASQDLIWLE